MATTDRREKLQQMIEKSPGDTFLLYAMAMEHQKANDFPEAIRYFDQVIQLDWGYCYAYYQKGKVQELQGDADAARQTYRTGIDAATRKGDAHAREELSAALSDIEP